MTLSTPAEATLTLAPAPGAEPEGTDHVHRLPSLPAALVAAARGRINTWVGSGMPDRAREQLSLTERLLQYNYVSYGDEDLRASPPLRRCLHHCDPHVRALIGDDAKSGEMQIALRFPGQYGHPHIDGMGDESRLHDPLVPTAVLAVYLSDVGPDDGAVGTWPQLLPEVRRYGRRSVADPDHDLDRSGYRALMAEAGHRPATALTGAAGTAFLFAGNLPHCNLLNDGPDVRTALFLRFYGRRHYPLGFVAKSGPAACTVLADPQALSSGTP